MGTRLPSGIGGLPTVELDRLIGVCTRYERDWRAGLGPRIEDFLAAAEESDRPALLHELVMLDVGLRRAMGECPTVRDYLERFPGNAGPIEAAVGPGESTITDDRAWASAAAPARPHARDESPLHHYRILGELGRGGMGVVYRALDLRRDVQVALKTIKRPDPEGIYRFKQEFRGLADATHPNLVPIYELASDGQDWYLVMELVDGVDFLRYVLEGNNPDAATEPSFSVRAGRAATELPETEPVPDGAHATVGNGPIDGAPPGHKLSDEQVLRLRAALAQLAAGLSALHAAGKLHRDIKPSNVLVTRSGRVVILDFGLAAEIEPDVLDRDSEPRALGTAAYMAPEQAAGLQGSPASDWYSVGVMLYQALTGRLPFEGRTLQVLMDKQLFEPPPPRQLVPEVPEDLEALCVEMLRTESEARVAGSEILDRLGNPPGGEDPAVLPPPRPMRHHLIGRESHLRALREAAEIVKAGRTTVLLMHGRSGAGKTRLVQTFLGELRRSEDVVILAGRCYENESVPYKALDGLIDALSRYLKWLPTSEASALLPRDVSPLVRVFPVLGQAEAVAEAPLRRGEDPDPSELRRRAFAALRELLARLGDRKHLVLSIDDLQWGDADSGALLAELLRPPDAPVLLLLGCYRSEHAATSPVLRALLGSTQQPGAWPDRREIEVGALSPADAEGLARHCLGGDDPATPALARAIARESGGNPYFIAELVRAIQSGTRESGDWLASGQVALDDVLAMRVARLPDDARRLLEVVAVSGQPIQEGLACQAAECRAGGRLAATILRAGRLIRSAGLVEGDTIEAYHDRVRESIVNRLQPEALRVHHRSLARALAASGQADPEELATHLLGAGEPEQAGDYFRIAAERAAQALAFDRAAELYRRALDLSRPEGEPLRQLRIAMGDALANAGRGADAARLYQAAASGADDGLSLDLLRRSAYQFCISGHVDEGRAVLAAVLERVGMRLPQTPRRVLASLLWNRGRLWCHGIRYRARREDVEPARLERIDVAWTASAGLSMFDVVAGAAFQAQGCLLALRAGEPFRLARALAWEAAHLSNIGGRTWEKTRRLLSQARVLAEAVPDPYAIGWTDLCEGVAHFTNGRWRPALEKLEQAERTLRDRCTGRAWELGTAHAFTLWTLLYAGDLAEMTRRATRLVVEARGRGDRYAATTHGAFCLPMAQLVADDPARARETVADALNEWSSVGFHVQHIIGLMCQTYIDLYSGRGEDAWRRIGEQWDDVVRSQLVRVQVLRSFLTHLRARSALAAARTDRSPAPLLRAARRDAARLLGERMAYCTPHARHLFAGIAALEGRRLEAIALLRDTVRGYEDAGMDLFAAAVRHRLGEAVGGEEGGRLIAEAGESLRGMGIVNIERALDAFAVAVV